VAVDLKPADYFRCVGKYDPGPHLIGVVTTDPDGIVPVYKAPIYETTTGEPLEMVMARSLVGYSPEAGTPYRVQVVTTEKEHQFYN